ncbi:MAG: hypothetical protein IH991_16260 [Planctomycetes bacterium]|nr:hypothetical protein [Planctomycetota bacterium]
MGQRVRYEQQPSAKTPDHAIYGYANKEPPAPGRDVFGLRVSPLIRAHEYAAQRYNKRHQGKPNSEQRPVDFLSKNGDDNNSVH